MYEYCVRKDITANTLLDYGFNSIDSGTYIYRVPAYKYERYPLLFIEFTILFDENNNRLLNIDCKDNHNNIYVPFYNNAYSHNNKVLELVNKKMKSVLNDLKKNKIIKIKK